MEFKNKEEILEHMTREMQIRGLISKEGSKSVFKREEMSTTELGNMVAIPHAMSNDSEEAVVSVMILKKPMKKCRLYFYSMYQSHNTICGK